MITGYCPLISLLSLLFGAVLIEIFGNKNKWIRNIVSLAATAVSCGFMAALIKPVFLEGRPQIYWLLNISTGNGAVVIPGYEIDHLSLVCGILTTGIFFFFSLYGIRYFEKTKCPKHKQALMLILAGGTLGFVCTNDMLVMFVMLELISLASAGLISFRDGDEAALKNRKRYFLIDSAGSILILAGIVILFVQSRTSDMAQIACVLAEYMNTAAGIALVLLLLGFIEKAVMNKSGIYGVLRVIFLLYAVAEIEILEIGLIIIGMAIMAAALVLAFRQEDLKKLLVFLGVSQVGILLMGIGIGTTLGLLGSIYYAVNAVFFMSLLFLCAGAVWHSTGMTDIGAMGGFGKRMPSTAICFLTGMVCLTGIPPFGGFVSVWLLLQAAVQKAATSENMTFLLVFIILLIGIAAMLMILIRAFCRIFYGHTEAETADVKDPSPFMLVPMWILAGLTLLMGLLYRLIGGGILADTTEIIWNRSIYIDGLWAEGYAQSAGIEEIMPVFDRISTWDPYVWTMLLGIILAILCIAFLVKRKEWR